MNKHVQVSSQSARLTDKEKARYFLLSSIAVAAVVLWGTVIALMNGTASIVWFVLPPLAACLLAPFYVHQGGSMRVAEHMLLCAALFCVLGFGFYTGGYQTGGLLWAVFIPALATIQIGTRAGMIYAAVSLSALVTLAVFYHTGVQPPMRMSDTYPAEDFLNKAPLALVAVTFLAVEVRARLEVHHRALAQRKQLDMLGNLTGSVAHDFNNLLAVIMGNLDLLEDELNSSESVRQMTADIRSAAVTGTELVRNLQALSQQRRLEPRPVPVALQIKENLPLIRRAVAKDKIELTVVDHSDGAVAVVDPAQFDSAILNLCMNARDAMPNGGTITIHISRADSRRPATDNVVIEIQDTGKGMSSDVLNRALEPFFSTKEVGDGSGLGLAMVNNFAEGAGGRVKLRSAPDQGTCVIIELPRVAPRPCPANNITSSGTPSGSEHVLVVDDEPSLRSMCQKMLQTLGYRVSVAGSALEARDILSRERNIAAVFTDRVMPGSIDGYQLASWIKQHRPGVAVLMTSGFSGKKPPPLSIPLLQKPYTRQDLATKLREVLDA